MNLFHIPVLYELDAPFVPDRRWHSGSMQMPVIYFPEPLALHELGRQCLNARASQVEYLKVCAPTYARWYLEHLGTRDVERLQPLTTADGVGDLPQLGI